MTTYKLPPAIAAALTTNRPELLKLATNVSHALAENTERSELERELLKLVGDLIGDRAKLLEQIDDLGKVAAETIKNVRGNVRVLEDEIAALVLRAPSGGV